VGVRRTGEAISLRVPNLPAKPGKVVKQIETPCSPDPIMRRPKRRPRGEASDPRNGPGKKCRSILTTTTPIREDSQNVPQAPSRVCDTFNDICDPMDPLPSGTFFMATGYEAN
jgi:hypothetical protein